jgi:predicted SAM-dependent methyltransferase
MTAIQHRRKSQFTLFAGQRGYRLNVGCGKKVVPGFINIDYVWHPLLDICWDVTKGLPFEASTASTILTEY